MARIRHLRNAPITEALIDIRAIPPKGFAPESLQQVVPRLQARYPIVEHRKGSEARFEIKPGSRLNAKARDLGLQAVFLKTSDQKQVAQFRLDGFTFNRLKPYTSWDDILPQALELWSEYVAVIRPEAVTRVAVRYINHITLPPASSELDELIVTGPRLPDGIPRRYTGFASRIALQDTNRRLSANVNQAVEIAVQETNPTLLLDIEAFRAERFDLDHSSLSHTLTQMRAYKNEIFFGSLTERCAEAFE